jgi:subtilisin family serine protease
LKESKAFPDSAKNTLFVFASGNDGTNNDSLPVSPANIKLGNTITVAATLGGEKLATFSNYGATNVEVAAPGVVIRAAIPGDEYLSLSGTSMAAPFVTNVATQIAEQNSSLTPAQIKKIIMDTVDKKDWLNGKVSSGGIVNKMRAFKAADLSLSMSLEDAILASKENIKDVAYTKIANVEFDDSDVVVAPLPAFFQ